jgi:hypothetical protein
MTDSQQPKNTSSERRLPDEIASIPDGALSAPNTTEGELEQVTVNIFHPSHEAFADFHEEYVSKYIQSADVKAAWVFAAATSILTVLFSQTGLSKMILVPDENIWSLLLIAAAMLCFLIAAISSFLVILPRLKDSGEGLIYFASVAEKKTDRQFAFDVSQKSSDELTDLRLRHTYDLSKVCKRKFELLVYAFRAMGTGILIGLILSLILA